MTTELAPIPPIALSNLYPKDINPDGTYLFLPQLFSNPDYEEFVQRSCKLGQQGRAFTILDNGAYEGMVTPSGRLMGLARNYQVNEVVVPDTLRDTDDTIQKVKAFGSSMRNERLSPGSPKYYMAVIQGTNLKECVRCFKTLHDEAPWVTTFGVPKHLVAIDIMLRLDIAKAIRKVTNTHAIHFLGSSGHWPSEIRLANGLGVRSMDTSLPFILANRGMRIDECHYDIPRPNQYFSLTRRDFDVHILNYNLAKLREWCAE